ncbi:MAG: hypothetical protein AAFX06_16555 [Planctomycetota bacterium]
MSNPYEPPPTPEDEAEEKPPRTLKQSPNQRLIKLSIFGLLVGPILASAVIGLMSVAQLINQFLQTR